MTNHISRKGKKVDSSKLEPTSTNYTLLLDEIAIVWDRTLSEKERLQEMRLICMDHGFCLRCYCFHHDGYCDAMNNDCC